MPQDAPQDLPIYASPEFTLWRDRVQQGDYVANAESAEYLSSNYPDGGETRVSRNVQLPERYARITSDVPLLDTLFNLSLEELQGNTRPDGALNAGADWQGVWTRDVSYSILLSLAALSPEAARTSLLQKVHRDRIVQDTGTGGSWPVSTDRLTWAFAAWEIYLTTGGRDWLEQAYRIIQNSVQDDELVVYNPVSGLFRGETSFLDWREQTYPRWMQPADICQSEALSTNVVYCRVYRILHSMARKLGLAGTT